MNPMKDMFKLLAKYNLETDNSMIEILENLPADKLLVEMGSYYHSVLGILNHSLVSDINWMKRIANYFPGLLPSAGNLPDIPANSSNRMLWGSLPIYKKIRIEVDKVIVEMVETIPTEQYPLRFHYKNKNGEEENKVGWHLLLHIFNHQTHHRGMIALILDQLNMANDYSNLIGIDY